MPLGLCQCCSFCVEGPPYFLPHPPGKLLCILQILAKMISFEVSSTTPQVVLIIIFFSGASVLYTRFYRSSNVLSILLSLIIFHLSY